MMPEFALLQWFAWLQNGILLKWQQLLLRLIVRRSLVTGFAVNISRLVAAGAFIRKK